MLDNLESLARSFINNKNRELVLLENCYGSTTTNNIFYYPDFIAIDFETANRNRNSACSLALIVVEENQIVNKKHWYINPPTDDFYFSYLHGITKSTVLNAPTLAELWETELKFYIENKIIVAHNASFDISVLQTSLSEAGITQSKIQYLDTVKELKNYIPIEEYRNEYRKLCSDNIPWIKIKKFKSAHTELRRLDKKRESLIELFIDELNPISSSTARTAAKSSGNFDVLHERMLYSKTLSEKSDEEIVALVVKQRTEAAVEFQRSIEQSLEQLSHLSLEFEPSSQKRRKMSL